MTISIVALGSSAEGWNKVKCDRSIAVNDAWKWGHHTTDLLVANQPLKFPQHRLNIIKASTPKQFWSQLDSWSTYFPGMRRIRLTSWDGHLYPERLDTFSHADTSPFIAISMSYKFGAKDIILWGVDMVDHHIYHAGNMQLKTEVKRYHAIIDAMEKEGVKVWLGSPGSALNLPVWHKNI